MLFAGPNKTFFFFFFFKYLFIKRPSKEHQSILAFFRLMRQITVYNDIHALFPASCQACCKFYNRLTGKGLITTQHYNTSTTIRAQHNTATS